MEAIDTLDRCTDACFEAPIVDLGERQRRLRPIRALDLGSDCRPIGDGDSVFAQGGGDSHRRAGHHAVLGERASMRRFEYDCTVTQ